MAEYNNNKHLFEQNFVKPQIFNTNVVANNKKTKLNLQPYKCAYNLPVKLLIQHDSHVLIYDAILDLAKFQN